MDPPLSESPRDDGDEEDAREGDEEEFASPQFFVPEEISWQNTDFEEQRQGQTTGKERRGFHVVSIERSEDGAAESKQVELVFFAERYRAGEAAGSRSSTRQKPRSDQEISLDTFRMQRRVTVERRHLSESPYFRRKLESEWRGARCIVIQLPRLGTVNALLKALEFLVRGEMSFEKRLVFELLAIAHFLELKALMRLCTIKIAQSLSAKNVVVASHFAYRCGMGWLLDRCYAWLCRFVIETGEFSFLLNMLGPRDHLPHILAGPVSPSSAEGLTQPESRRPFHLAATEVAVSEEAAAADAAARSRRVLSLVQGVYNVPATAFLPVFLRRQRVSMQQARPWNGKFVGTVTRARLPTGEITYTMTANDAAEPLLVAKYVPAAGEYIMATKSRGAEIDWHHRSSVGSIRSNLTGTQFSVFDYGPTEYVSPELFPCHSRIEWAVVHYKRNILGTVPREFTVVLRTPPPANPSDAVVLSPRSEDSDLSDTPDSAELDDESARAEVKQAQDSEEKREILSHEGPGGGEDIAREAAIHHAEPSEGAATATAPQVPPVRSPRHEGTDRKHGVLVLHNRQPVWNEALSAFTLDFGDHVKLPSKKNFQLIEEGDPSRTTYLMFGKVKRDQFYLDFSYPVSPLQAFGIIITSFDKKRLVT